MPDKTPTMPAGIQYSDATKEAIKGATQSLLGSGEVHLVSSDIAAHPLFPIFVGAIQQAMHGKGQRHGGARTPFLDQPWVHYAKLHGRGFLTGQAAKKLEEAANTRAGTAFEQEVFGAMVYLGMSVLYERDAVPTTLRPPEERRHGE